MRLFKSLRFSLHYLIALFKRYYLIVLISSFIGGVLAIVLTVGIKQLFPIKSVTQKIGIWGQYTNSNLPDEVTGLLSFGLTKFDKNGELLPGVADKWTISSDGKQYEFFIIPEKFIWSNGQVFSINDLNYTFQDVSIDKTDRSIVFKLNEEFSPLPSILSKPLFLKNFVGLGDYQVTKIINKGNVVDSIFISQISSGLLNKKVIVFRFFPTITDLITGFNMGEVDYISNLPSVTDIYTSPRIKVEPYTDYQVYTALYFSTDKPEFADKSFRQALAYAVQKPNDENRAFSSYSPSSWVYNNNVKPYFYDINRALDLVKKDVFEKTREITISVFPQDSDLAQQIVEDWQDIGLKAKIVTINVIPDSYDALLISRQIPLEVDQYSFWHSTQAGNLSEMRNPRLDKLLEDGRKTIDRESRKNIYLDFQRYLLEECPAIFISHPTRYRVTRI